MLPVLHFYLLISALLRRFANHAFTVRCCLVTLTIGHALPAFSSADSADIVEHVITTATRLEKNLTEYIGSASALDADALAITGHTHVQQSLLRVPGVNLHRGNGQEYLPAIRSPVLTGAGGCGGFLMAEDGIALRAAGFCNINELFESHTEMAQRIEVLRGPGTALYGSNALHGVINVITPDTTRPGGFAGLEVGPYDYGRFKLSAGAGDETSGFGATLSVTHDGGYRADSGFDQQKFSARHRYQSGALRIDTGLSLTNLEQETAGFITGLDAYRDEVLARSNPNPEAYRNAQSMRLWSRFTYDASDDASWVITPYIRYTDMEFLQHFLPGDPLEKNGQQGVGLQSSYHFSASETVDLIAGVDTEFTRGFLEQSQDAPTQGSAFLQATIPAGQHYDYDVDATMVAPFMQADWQISERLHTSLGVRFEYMDYDYTNNMLTGRTADDGTICGFGGCRYSRPPSGSNSFENWSPKLGVSYELNKSALVYASLARGFRAPQATELYRLQRGQSVADLKSERADSFEIGVKGETAVLRYSLALYAMEKENFIFRDSDFFNVSDGQTDHEGVELELIYRLSEAWDFSMSANYARHTYAYDRVLSGININNNDIDTAPRRFGSARLGWNFSRSGRAELEWQHMGSYYMDPENLREYDGHDVLNLRAQWSPVKNVSLYARLINVTDEVYAERADFTSFSGERYFPGIKRTLYAGAEWSW